MDEFLAEGDLSRLASEARARRELVVRVRAELDSAEAEHVISACVNAADELVVGMDSSAWAARLRYSRDELLGFSLKVRVTAPGSTPAGSAAAGAEASQRSIDGDG
jgi:hypothetical protein